MEVFCFWQAEDIPAVAALERECFPDPWTQDALLAQQGRANHYGIVCKRDGELIGYIYGTVLFEDAEIYKVAVRPDCRGQGLGRRLVEEAFAFFKQQNAERVFLEVRAGNVAARKLYENSNFTTLRIRKNYYSDGEDAVEMTTIL
jgi:ribosomal-protein-alanine N-acetyltransferase